MSAPQRTKQIRVYFGTVVICAFAVALHAAWYVSSILAGPPSPDLYANNVGFQLFAFAFVRLPYWLTLLFVVLFIEIALYSWRTSHEQT
jgi:hypothetical protein